MSTSWLIQVLRNKRSNSQWDERQKSNGYGAHRLTQNASNGHEPSDQARTSAAGEPYVLETGRAASYRLELLQCAYGPGTLRLLRDAGLRSGMAVADIGCGVGTVTSALSELVGSRGRVVGFDLSAAQLDEARQRLAGGGANCRFVEASATDIRWPSESFDLVYCRFLLMHLTDPAAALREMRRVLKPGGVLVCEDGDLTSAGSEPPSALGAFAELFGKLSPLRGVDYRLGRRLYQLVEAAGFGAPEIAFNQPVVARGECKRLLELSVAEAGPAFVSSGLISEGELAETLAEMRRVAADERVLAVMPRMSQVRARKPAVEVQTGDEWDSRVSQALAS
jgi:SAM-dependent methyltransferase